MPFEKTSITRFAGLNTAVAPELIEDGEARDILNLRMEVVGKLVTRNGSIIGFTHGALPFSLDNAGCHGIGEFTLSEKWSAYDTDRFQVYLIDNAGTGKGHFIFVPLTGRFADQYAFDFSRIDPRPQGGPEGGKVDLTPMKPTTDWISRFADMNQYNNALVVSDRVNGDGLFTDRFDEREPYKCEGEDHGIEYRANCLEKFDIDTIEIDVQLATGEKNDGAIKNGMALYNFKLPKRDYVMTDDRFRETLTAPGYLPSDTGKADAQLAAYFGGGNPSSMIAVAFYDEISPPNSPLYKAADGVDRKHLLDIRMDVVAEYTFTNADAPGEFDDVFGRLKLNEDKFTDDEGQRTEYASDVYIWEDVQVDYFASSGIARDAGNFLRDLDRFWSKMFPGAPRIKKLNVKTGGGRTAPLGVWRYRFVWDFGNGVYSAPSAEMLCPDILFSAVPDDELAEANTYYDGSPDEYARPSYLQCRGDDDSLARASEDIIRSTLPVDGEDYGDPGVTGYPKQFHRPSFVDPRTPQLTRVATLLHRVKQELYSADHLYGYAIDDPAFATADELGRILTTVTGFFSASDMPMKGFIGETANTNNGNVVTRKLQLVVPMFQGVDLHTYNSVFTDDGKYRIAFINPNSPSRSLVWTGFNPFFYRSDAPTPTPHSGTSTLSSIRTPDGISTDLWLNIVGDQTDSGDWDHNNDPNPLYDIKRAATIFRGIKSESDSLEFVGDSVDPNAIARLLLSGTCELTLSTFGDLVDFQSGTIWKEGSTFVESYLRRTQKRERQTMTPIVSSSGAKFLSVLNPSEFPGYSGIGNLRVIAYGSGARLTAVEQITSYFPSSLLFRAPRVMLRVQDADVPRRAKRLLIFRTRCSHDNQWDPQEFALAKEVEIEWEGTEPSRQVKDGAIEFFDDIRDDKLNFGKQPAEYEGLRTPLKSAFNIAINEHMYYANYKESYQPEPPRGQEGL